MSYVAKTNWLLDDVVLPSDMNRIEQGISDADVAVSEHLLNLLNPHGTTKAQVGLSEVANYGVASQAQAEAGTVTDKYMTPERTKQAINTLQAVKSVAGKTGDVVLGKADVGLSNVSNDAQLKIASNLSDLNNVGTARSNLGLSDAATTSVATIRAGTTKADVGLGNVENLLLATAGQAVDSNDNTRYMTPQQVFTAMRSLGIDSSNSREITDFNSATLGGFYYAQVGALNNPNPAGSRLWSLLVVPGNNENNLTQIAHCRNLSGFYVRSRSTAVWGVWRKIFTSEEEVQTRINNGVFEYYDGGEWKAVSIITKQMKTANYLNSGNSVSGTWYTVLDVSSGKGVLSRAIAYLDSYNAGNLFLRITLDGVATVVSGLAGSFLVRGAIPIDTTMQTRSIEVITPVYFNNSLKVEIMQNTGATITIQSAVDYSLV